MKQRRCSFGIQCDYVGCTMPDLGYTESIVSDLLTMSDNHTMYTMLS